MKKWWLGLFFLLVPLLLAGFFMWQAVQAHRAAERAGLPESDANAIKHATAGKAVYRVLDNLRVIDPQKAVLWLGKANEYAEQFMKFRDRDTTLEIMKDSYNNYAGIMAAQWVEKHGRARCGEDAIVVLVRRGALILAAEDIALPPADKEAMRRGADIPAAMQWLEQQRTPIEISVRAALDGCLK